MQAIIWRQEWEQTRAWSEKEKLVRYNAEDCAALELVAGAVGQMVQENIEGNSETQDRIEEADDSSRWQRTIVSEWPIIR